MDNDFFADRNWPYKLEVSGAFVSSASDSITDQRFLHYHYYHHLPTALAALLALPPDNFDQTTFRSGYERPLYQNAAIVTTDTRTELMSLQSMPPQVTGLTGPTPGLYLQLEGLAGVVAGRYNLPLQRLSHYDPTSILIKLASYGPSAKHTLLPDPQLAGLVSSLRGGPLTSKDAFQLRTAYHGQFGGFTMQISYHFDSHLHGLCGLLHHPVENKIPPIQRTVHMTAEDTVLSKGGTILGLVAHLPKDPWAAEPPRGFYLQLPKAKGSSVLGPLLSGLPLYNSGGDPLFQLATLDGGRPQELPALIRLRAQLDQQVRRTTHRTLRQMITRQAKRVFASLGGSRSP